MLYPGMTIKLKPPIAYIKAFYPKSQLKCTLLNLIILLILPASFFVIYINTPYRGRRRLLE